MKQFFATLLILTLGGFGYFAFQHFKYAKESVPAQVEIANLIRNAEKPQPEKEMETPVIEEVEIPEELNLKVPFYSQAPFSNWDYPWQEACEEASILLAANEYFDHNWSREEFNEEILKLVEWEKERFGYYEHTSVGEIVETLKEYLKLDAVIHEDPSFEDVQRILVQGHLIVMTFAGKELGNPNYTNGGPVYHAMLIKGYKEGKIITHDVGTRRGEDYVYSWETIYNSLHDYSEPISEGEKIMIEILPPTNGS